MTLAKEWFKARMDELKDDPEFLRDYIDELNDEIKETRKRLIAEIRAMAEELRKSISIQVQEDASLIEEIADRLERGKHD